MNTVIVLGKLISFANRTEDNILVKTMVIEVPRPFANSNGEIENDYFNVELWRGLSEMISENLPLNSTVAIKGRLQSQGTNCIIIAEKLTFLH